MNKYSVKIFTSNDEDVTFQNNYKTYDVKSYEGIVEQEKLGKEYSFKIVVYDSLDHTVLQKIFRYDKESKSFLPED